MNSPQNDTVPAAPPAEWGVPRTKTITWFDAHAARRRASQLSGQEYLQGIVEGRFPPPPIAQLVGARLVFVGEGEAVFRCVPDESFLNPIGLVHGGLLCTLMDSAMGVAVQSTMAAMVACPSIEIKVSFLKPLPHDGTEVEVRGRALRVGKRIAFAEGHAYDAHGTLVGHGTSSLAVAGPT